MDRCPENHTVQPEGYTAWHDWAGRMYSRGYRQQRCPGCELFAIWVAPLDKSALPTIGGES